MAQITKVDISDKPFNEKFQIELPQSHKVLNAVYEDDRLTLIVLASGAPFIVRRTFYIAELNKPLPAQWIGWGSINVAIHPETGTVATIFSTGEDS